LIAVVGVLAGTSHTGIIGAHITVITIPVRTSITYASYTLVRNGTEITIFTGSAIAEGLGNTLICTLITHAQITLIPY